MSADTPPAPGTPVPGPHLPAELAPLPSSEELLEPLHLLDDAALSEHPAHFESLLARLTAALEEES